MIVSVGIGSFGSARVWIDEDVNADYAAEATIERRLLTTPSRHLRHRRVVVEVYLPRGPRAEYGLLGLMYEPKDESDLLVRVQVGREDGRPSAGSMASNVDDVRIGLPREYASAVLDAICQHCQNRIGPGLLTIDRAAHGRVGSSVSVFSALSALAVALVESDDAVDNKVRSAFA